MWRLIRAEWLKTSRRPFDVVVALVLVTAAAVAPIVIGVKALADSSRLDGARQMLGAAESLVTVMLVAPLLALVLGPLVAASAVGSEYGDGTWAAVFARTARRWPVLLAKLAVVWMTVTAVAVGSALIWLAGCRAIGHFLLEAGPGVVPDGLAGRVLALAAVSLGEGLFNALVAALAAILTRSSLAGAAIGLLAPPMSRVVALTAVGAWLPATLFQRLREMTGSAAGFATAATPEPGAAILVAVLVLYAGGVVAASVWTIDRQDIPC